MDRISICKSAIASGQLETVRWLLDKANEQGFADETTSCLLYCSVAIQGKHLDLLRYLRSVGCPWDEDTFRRALQCEYMPVLEYILTEYPFDARNLKHAVQSASLELLRWLRQKYPPFDMDRKETLYASWWDATLFETAVSCRALPILQWLRCECECPWNEKVCIIACQNGIIDTLEWLLEQGCPRDMDHCYRAAFDAAQYGVCCRLLERVHIVELSHSERLARKGLLMDEEEWTSNDDSSNDDSIYEDRW